MDNYNHYILLFLEENVNTQNTAIASYYYIVIVVVLSNYIDMSLAKQITRSFSSNPQALWNDSLSALSV